jgi:integrase/recombinase XerD
MKGVDFRLANNCIQGKLMAEEIVHAPASHAVTAPVADGISIAMALLPSAELWANATTSGSSVFRRDLLRTKVNAVLHFFEFVAKPPTMVTPEDVRAWQQALEEDGLAQETVYGRISRVSSFYEWALKDPTLARHLKANPVKLARPKAPKPYQSERIKALRDEDVDALLAVVRATIAGDDPVASVVARRDYALLLFYLLSGMRRTEIIRLRWCDVDLRRDGSVVLSTKVKGGTYLTREIADPSAQQALLDYLHASGRFDSMTTYSPLWVAHDRAQTTPSGKAKRKAGKPGTKEKVARTPGKPLSSHGFVKRLKEYAKEAGLEHIHLHQTRHTYARLVSEEAGSIIEVQDALGHKNLATTRVYAQRVAIKRDKHSRAIANRLGLNGSSRDAS